MIQGSKCVEQAQLSRNRAFSQALSLAFFAILSVSKLSAFFVGLLFHASGLKVRGAGTTEWELNARLSG